MGFGYTGLVGHYNIWCSIGAVEYGIWGIENMGSVWGCGGYVGVWGRRCTWWGCLGFKSVIDQVIWVVGNTVDTIVTTEAVLHGSNRGAGVKGAAHSTEGH